MIVTNSFVYLHLNKTGGTFINNIIKRFFLESKSIGYHLPYRFLPQQYKDLPVLGSIRNPWSYYVSFYHFQKEGRKQNAVYNAFSEQDTCDFKQTITNMLSPQDRHLTFLHENSPEKMPNRGANLSKLCIEELSKLKGGWYSRLYQRLYGGETFYALRTETLRDDLLEFCDLHGIIKGQDFDDYIENSPNKNTSTHKQYTYYYDDDLISMVEKYDSLITHKYGYKYD
jgi:hypothetical protein